MKEIEEKILVEANLERAYEVAERYPLFVDKFPEKEIIFSDDKTAEVRITNRFFLFPLSWEGKGIKKRNEYIHWVQTRGLLKGLRAEWSFKPRGENSTEIIIKGSYREASLKGKILEFVAPFLIYKTTRRILRALKDAAERNSWTSLK